MEKLNSTIKFIRKVSKGIYNFIDSYNNDTCYLFDFTDVLKQYEEVKESYQKHPGYFDLDDFSKNYTFGFYQEKGLLNYQQEGHIMEQQIKDYLRSLNNDFKTS